MKKTDELRYATFVRAVRKEMLGGEDPQAKIADRLGVSEAVISRFLSRDRPPSGNLILRLVSHYPHLKGLIDS